MRQWVLSLPMPLRFRLAWDGERCREVLATFLSAVFVHCRDATGLADGGGGPVTFEQTFGSSLHANRHFHALVLDGVYEADAAVFHPAPSPTTAEVQLVVDQVRERVEALLRARGLVDGEGEVAGDDDDGRRLLLAASVAGREALGLRAGAVPRWMRQHPVRRLRDRCAAAGSFHLHAAVRIAPHDREALERLCRYVQRPPLSHDRLTRQADGTLFLKFKRGWDDGTTGIGLTPHQLLARLVAILPQPRRNLTHDHGVFAPAARGRADIVPRPKVEPGPRLTLLPARVKARRRHHPAWIPWAELLFRVFGADALACPPCDGRLRVHAVIQGRWATRRVLGCVGRPSATPRSWSARGPPVAA